MDYTYFKEYTSPILYQDSSTQGAILCLWSKLKSHIKNSLHDTIIKCDHWDPSFKILLSFYDRIHHFYVRQNTLYIVIKEGLLHPSPKRRSPHKLIFLSDLTKIRSRAIRFLPRSVI